MSPAEARREAHRILRDASASMRRSLGEAERLLQLAEGDDVGEIRLRRSMEELALLEPELAEGLQ